MTIDKSTSLEEQYDNIYRYCYFKVKKQELAEDITQETFLRFYERFGHYGNGWTLQYLYRIARNLCVDEYRRKKNLILSENEIEEWADEGVENKVISNLVIKEAMSVLSEEEKEMLLLRYVNEVEIGTMCKIYHISRFALYRKMKKAIGKLQKQLGEEEFFENRQEK